MLCVEEMLKLWSCCWNTEQIPLRRTIWEGTCCRTLYYICFFSESYMLSCAVASNFTKLKFPNLRYCEAFPAIKGAIQRVQREKDRIKQKNDDNKSSKSSTKSDLKTKSDVTASSAGTSSKSFTLQRREKSLICVRDSHRVFQSFLMKCTLLSTPQ